MTSNEFVIWLKGVVVGAPQYQPTPDQWSQIREQLKQVNDSSWPMGGLIMDHNTFRVHDTPIYADQIVRTGDSLPGQEPTTISTNEPNTKFNPKFQ